MLLTQKLTRKSVTIISLVAAFFFTQKVKAQTTPEEIEQIGYLLSDALLYSQQYIVPATDAAVYQASAAWVMSPKKRKKWDVSLGLHTNVFFCSKSGQNIPNSKF